MKNPKEKIFKDGTFNYKVEKAMNPDPDTGISKIVSIKDLEDLTGLKIVGNGCKIRDDGSLAEKYHIKKYRESVERPTQVTSVEFRGYNIYKTNKRTKSGISKTSLKKLEKKEKRCINCFSKNKIEKDHKHGRKESGELQWLCKQCNGRKREICKECKATGKRFKASKYGYRIDFIKGTKKYVEQEEQCDGCYWYDPEKFRKSLTLE